MIRLLHFGENGALKWTTFRPDDVPPYAILSHRWGSDEVLYEDLIRSTVSSKPGGHRKLLFCGQQARKDGLEYFWSDTCCINKDDRTELSRAINSMFLWYQNAQRCYVLLSDVSVPDEDAAKDRNAWEPAFRSSVWHTRGWTLQELIAPTSVDFFSCQAQKLGNKSELESLLHEITCLPRALLRGGSVADFEPADRLRWAAQRFTTEPEDSAYCLLGLLDVDMPLMYGEGGTKAMSRLIEAMQSTTISTIPFSRNEAFIGREAQLIAVARIVEDDTQMVMLGILGESGSGKTQFALEMVHRIKSNSDRSVFWIDASTKHDLLQGFTNIIRKLRIPGWQDVSMDPLQLVQEHLQSVVTHRWNLVLDGLEGLKLDSKQLIDRLPQSKKGAILITTSRRDIAERLAPQHVIELDDLTLTDAREMMVAGIGRNLTSAERKDIDLLVGDLSFLPLAIVQAAAHIFMTGCTVQSYRNRLISEKLVRDQNPTSTLALTKVHDPIAATLKITLEYLQAEHPLPTRYLAIASCIYHRDVVLDLLAPSTAARMNAIQVLQAYKLITRRVAEGSVDIQHSVHIALQTWIQAQEKSRLVDLMGEAQDLSSFLPDPSSGEFNKSQNLGKWKRVMPHMIAFLSHSRIDVDATLRIELERRCAVVLYMDGRLAEAEELQLKAIGHSEGRVDLNYLEKSMDYRTLCAIYEHQGRWQKAETLRRRSIDICCASFNEDHPEVSMAISGLAMNLQQQGRFDEAEHLLTPLVRKFLQASTGNSESTADIMGDLAMVYLHQCRHQEAEKLQLRVVKINTRIYAEETTTFLMSISNLSLVYIAQQRWEDAKPLILKALDINSRLLGSEHPTTVKSSMLHAKLLLGQDNLQDAESLTLRVLQTSRRTLGEEHPDTLTYMNALAQVYQAQSRWQEAAFLHLRVMGCRHRILGADNAFTLESMLQLAESQYHSGRQVDGLKLMFECYSMQKKVLGEQHPVTLLSASLVAAWGPRFLAGELMNTEPEDTTVESRLQNIMTNAAPGFPYAIVHAPDGDRFSQDVYEPIWTVPKPSHDEVLSDRRDEPS